MKTARRTQGPMGRNELRSGSFVTPGQSERVLRARAAPDSMRCNRLPQRYQSGAALRSQATYALPRRDERTPRSNESSMTRIAPHRISGAG